MAGGGDRRAGGNPLFVTEIARAVGDGTWRPDQPPRSVRDIVTARLDRLGTDAWLTIATPPTQSLDQLDRVMGSATPDGLRARYACRAGGEFRIIAVWESEEHADRFFREVLGPVLARVLGPEPSGAPAVTGMEVLREFIPAVAG